MEEESEEFISEIRALMEERKQIREEQICQRKLLEEILKKLTDLATKFGQLASKQNISQREDQESKEFGDKVKYVDDEEEESGKSGNKVEDEEMMEEDILETAQAKGFSEKKEEFEFALLIDSHPSSLPDTSAYEISSKDRICPIVLVFNRHFIGRGGGRDPTDDENLVEGVAQLMLKYEKLNLRLGSESSSLWKIFEAKDLKQFYMSALVLVLWKWKFRDMG